MLLLLKAHVQLNYLGLSAFPDATLGMVDRLAAGYDIKVLEWVQKITSYHSGDFHETMKLAFLT